MTDNAPQVNAQGKRKPGWMSIPGGPKEPNFQTFQAKLQELTGAKKQCFDALAEIREQLDAGRGDEDDEVRQERKRLQERMKEIREERKKLNGQKEEKFSERLNLQSERRALQRQIQDMTDDLSGFDSLEAIAGAIDRVLINMETGSGSLKSEKKTLKRITQLEKAKQMVQELQLLEERQSEATTEDRELGQEYSKIRADMEALDKQFKEVAQKKDSQSKLEKKSYENRDAIKEKRTGIRAEIDSLNAKITDLRKEFDDGKAKWNEWKEVAIKQYNEQREKQQKEWEEKRAAQEAARKLEQKKRRAAKRLNPFKSEIEACASLIRFLTDKAANRKAQLEEIEREKKLAAFNAAETAPQGKVVAGFRDDEEWAMGKPKKQQKQKAPKAKKVEAEKPKAPQGEKLITFSAERRTAFDSVKVEYPANYGQIEATIATLKQKKTDYESHIKSADEISDHESEASDAEDEEEAEAETAEEPAATEEAAATEEPTAEE